MTDLLQRLRATAEALVKFFDVKGIVDTTGLKRELLEAADTIQAQAKAVGFAEMRQAELLTEVVELTAKMGTLEQRLKCSDTARMNWKFQYDALEAKIDTARSIYDAYQGGCSDNALARDMNEALSDD